MSISENAKKAAQWWTSQLRSSSVNLDNGENDPNLPAVLALIGPYNTNYSEDQFTHFEDSLVQHIEYRLATRGNCIISVDYDPDDTLCAAAEFAGINPNGIFLPIKTCTEITQEKVILSHGHSGPEVKL